MARALLIIDIQNDYFPGGAFPLVEPDAAAANAARVLEAFRDGGEAIVHVQHLSGPEDPFFVPGTPGVEIHASVAPAEGELIVQKKEPNSFLGTELEAELRASGTDELVVAGMMSSMCVDATVRAASDLGFTVQLVHDACAAPNLEFGGQAIPGAAVHGAFMAALGSAYATVVDAESLTDR
ncbi:cysteine hydrolase family protein [Baekduia sp. Peel2402]|uniref:cysteine hydrolase family protein n=1 Tax=Baekduia sp. Peel2402 TaxID=3458296 RepID=UPI00403E661B